MKDFDIKAQYLTHLINRAFYLYGYNDADVARFLLSHGVNIYIGNKAKSVLENIQSKESKSNE